MKGYISPIEDLTNQNASFRHVLYSGEHLQLVLMSLQPGEEIGSETHADTDQFFRIEQGQGRIVIDGACYRLRPGDVAIVPAGASHNLVCTGDAPLKLYTLYGPAHHMDKLVQRTKAEADRSSEAFDGIATEVPPAPILL